MIRMPVVLEDRGQPDRGAAEAGDVIEMVCDASQCAAIEGVLCSKPMRPAGLRKSCALGAVMETIDEDEVDEFLSPFSVDRKVRLASRGREVDLINRRDRVHSLI